MWDTLWQPVPAPPGAAALHFHALRVSQGLMSDCIESDRGALISQYFASP